MKLKLLIPILFLICNLSNAQKQEFSNIINERLNQFTSQVKLNQILQSTNFKGGDKVRIFASFVLTEEGELTDVLVRAPHPKVEDTVENILSNIIIENKLTQRLLSENKDGKFSIPIFFEVMSKSELRRFISKENRKRKKKS